MAFQSHRRDAGAAIGEINMIPMIDVMLVLLVIVLLAAPLLPHAMKTDLPRIDSAPEQANPAAISLEIAADGRLRLNGAEVTEDSLNSALKPLAGPRAELRLLAEPTAAYDKVARAMAAAGRAGIGAVSFITLPEAAAR